MSRRTADDYKAAIEASELDIYAPIDPDDRNLYIPTPILEELLNRELVGLDLSDYKLRTRSKIVKQAACRALGYPTPTSFKKCQPRFTGQDFDTSNQQKLNMQIWNEPIVPTRRYALIRIGEDHKIRIVKVIPGSVLVDFDRTGTVTTKYQAQLKTKSKTLNLFSHRDTPLLTPYLTQPGRINSFPVDISPAAQPEVGRLLPIAEIFSRLSPLVGVSFKDAGKNQERNRGAALHRLACKALGYANYQDNGQFPDIRHQLLEVKLQTSPTIDLGLALPNGTGAIKDVHRMGEVLPRHCDTRYALFNAEIVNERVLLTHLFVVSGAEFFKHFRQFKGKIQSGKIQFPLPRQLFGE
jgi:hypothetical protein